jgi:hypothetical protein
MMKAIRDFASRRPLAFGALSILLGILIWKLAIWGIDTNAQQLAWNSAKQQEAAAFNARGGSISVSYNVEVLDIRPELQILKWLSLIPFGLGVLAVLKALSSRPATTA